MGTSDRRAREKDAKRRAILSAAIRCFGEKGYDGTTLDEVGRRAEVAKGTLYLYFKSKADLFASLLLKQGFDVFIETLQSELKSCQDFPSALEAFSRVFQNLCLEGNKEIFEFFLQLDRGDISRDLSPDLRDEARRRMEPLLDQLAGFLHNGRKNTKRAAEGRRISLVLWALCIGVAHLAKGGALGEIGMKPRDILETGTDCILKKVTLKI